jgi:membrane-associated phospholipid phosphatase
MHVEWATLTPFAMTTARQFRPAGPPNINSAAYRHARATVELLGAAHSTQRTAEQTEIAHYWSDAIGTYAPAGHWNAITASIVAPMQLGIATEAELFAELNVAIADASIGMSDAKYTFWSWRPISAIRAGDGVTEPLPSWTPLLTTPNHPSYVSGHSAFSGAAATVLTDWFGDRAFTFSSASLPGVTRHFTNFQQAAEEAAASRVYGGIHFPFDNADGLALGRAVGAWTMANFQRLDVDRGPFLMVGGPMTMMAAADKTTVIGCALDNVAPVATVTASLDGNAPFSVPVDEHGMFALPASRIDMSRRHDLVLAATSATGHTSTVRVAVGP